MLREAAALQTATRSASDGTALGATRVVSWRALATAALLSVVFGAALFEGVAGERTSVAPAVRSGGFSHKGLLSLPLAVQGPVSAALGAGSPAYRVSTSSGGFAAASPAQRLSLRFGRSGVSVGSGATHLGLSLQAVGYGTSLTALGKVTPRVKANRVTYAHPGLEEWYVNGPLGLEQGFTILKAPAGHSAGPLTLSIALSGNAHASLASDGQNITLSHPGGPSLRYGGLRVSDARGRALRSRLALQNGQLLLRVDMRGACYPLRVDPFIQQGEEFSGSEEVGRESFGLSVALSGDGDTALIGGIGSAWVFTRTGSTWSQQGPKLTGEGDFGASAALSSDGNTALIGASSDNQGAGAAWVFTRSGSTWTQQGGKLTGGEETEDGQFGGSVALSADGNTALIGGSGDGVGAAWVFTRSESTWTQQGTKLTGSGESGAGQFGGNVALSSDGNTALIGGPYDNNSVGASWVFTRSGSTWTQQGEKLTGSGAGFFNFFGASVALSSDGNTALIGGPGEGGAAWVFTRSGSTWTQQGEKLTASGESGAEWFGSSVALSSDGNTALIGGGGWGGNHVTGAAWVFTRSESTWVQGPKLSGSGEGGEGGFGQSVALSSDGSTALIGASLDRDGVGGAWVYTRSGSTWTQEGETLRGGEEIGGVEFGASVAMSADGDTALIGGPYDDGSGAAWVFTRSGSTWTQQGPKLTSGGELFDRFGRVGFGFSVALSSDGNTALIGGANDNESGAAWVFTRSRSTWTQQGSKLTGTGETTYGGFGGSVALSADGDTALIGATNNEDVGAAWVFTRSGSTWTQQGSRFTGSGASGSCDPCPGFGASVALSSDGNTALIGGPNDNNLVGAAWVFTRSGSTWTQQGKKLTGAAEIGAGDFGASVALSADGNTALIGGPSDNEAGAGWVFTRSGSTWTQQGPKLTGSGEVSKGAFGYSVALSSNGNTALIVARGGAAWIFTWSGSAWIEREQFTATEKSGAELDPASLSAAGNTVLIGGRFENDNDGAAWVFVNRPVAPTVVTGVASSLTRTSATLNATVNPEGETVSDCHFEYGTSLSYGSSVPCASPPGSGESPVAVSVPVGSLSESTTYHFRIVATNPTGTSYGADETFTTRPDPPTVVTEAASSVEGTSATLNATVNPEGETVSDCHFEYGTSLSYGSSVPCASLPGSGESPVAVSASVGLTESTTYHFRIAASNAAGTSYGADQTFTTLAACATNSGTVVLSPGLTDTPVAQTMKIKGTLTGCSGEQFKKAKYIATLKTGGPVSCTVLQVAGETAAGAAKYTWTPKAKASAGTLSMPLTETPGNAFSGEVTSGSYSPLTLSGTVTESYTGGATCGEKVGKKAAKAVKKSTFSGSAVSF